MADIFTTAKQAELAKAIDNTMAQAASALSQFAQQVDRVHELFIAYATTHSGNVPIADQIAFSDKCKALIASELAKAASAGVEPPNIRKALSIIAAGTINDAGDGVLSLSDLLDMIAAEPA